jgi:ArsR family transcriptional regulator, arsenate/arsenite/antimonite-responsive transcriptional repressor
LDIIKLLKALSDETRIRILNLLKEEDLCVCELESILDLNQSNVSRHLEKLTNAKLVDYYKKAKYVYYKLVDNTVNEYPFIMELLNCELCKIEQCIRDANNLRGYKAKGISCEDLKQCKEIKAK